MKLFDIRRETIRKHQNRDWETTTHRNMDGFRRRTWPALQRYEWMLIDNDVAWPDYKSKTNVKPGDT